MLRAAVLLGLLSVYLGAPLSHRAGNSADSLKPLVRVKRDLPDNEAAMDKKASMKTSVDVAETPTNDDDNKQAEFVPGDQQAENKITEDLTADEVNGHEEAVPFNDGTILQELEQARKDAYAKELSQQVSEDASGEIDPIHEDDKAKGNKVDDEDYENYDQYLFGDEFPDFRKKRAVSSVAGQQKAATAEDMVMTSGTSKGARVKRDLRLTPGELRALLQGNQETDEYGYDDLYNPVKRSYEGDYDDPSDEYDEEYEDIPNSWEPDQEDDLGLGYGEEAPLSYEQQLSYDQELAQEEAAEEAAAEEAAEEAAVEKEKSNLASLLYYLANSRNNANTASIAAAEQELEEQNDPYVGYEQEALEQEYVPTDVSPYESDEKWEDAPVVEENPEYEPIVYYGKPGLFIPMSKRQYLSMVPGVKKRDYNPYSSLSGQSQWGAFKPHEEAKRSPSPADYERLYQLAAALRGSDDWEEYKKKK